MIVPSLSFSEAMKYLIPEVEVEHIIFDREDPSNAQVVVRHPEYGQSRPFGLHVTLVDDEHGPVYSNHETVG